MLTLMLMLMCIKKTDNRTTTHPFVSDDFRERVIRTLVFDRVHLQARFHEIKLQRERARRHTNTQSQPRRANRNKNRLASHNACKIESFHRTNEISSKTNNAQETCHAAHNAGNGVACDVGVRHHSQNSF